MSNLFSKEIETIGCPLCGSSSYKIYDKLGDWTIAECNQCGFRYTNPRPKIEVLPSFYTEEYFKDERHFDKFYNRDYTIKQQSDNDYTNRVLDIESHVPARGRLLEIGAARGGFLDIMKKRGWIVSGVEISKDAVRLGKELYDIDIFQGTMEEYETQEKFDVVCMYQTLEHVPNAKFIVKRSYELLNKSGIIVIEVPNIESIENKVSRRLKYERYDLPRHLNHFSPSVLRALLKNTGFSVIYCDNYPPFIWTDIFKKIINRKNKKASSKSTELNIKEMNVSIPLMTATKLTVKQNMLHKFSNWLPGWRVTIIGEKI
jgi:2-polyprenyl-3-methyl-5-hydroxy-6-metoxy-1,4-benzoquinol methylase